MRDRLFALPRRAGTGPASAAPAATRWPRVLLAQRLAAAAKGRRVGFAAEAAAERVDVLLAGPDEPDTPEVVFPRLRWGGLFGCIHTDAAHVAALAAQFDGRNGFVLDTPPDTLWAGPAGVRIPGVTPRGHYFIARKTELTPPGRLSDRFTYHVALVADDTQPTGHCVRKRVPSVDSLIMRLLQRTPTLDDAAARRRAEHLADEALPLFLTREARVLQTLRQRLPEPMRCRVPRVLRFDRDARGRVTQIDLTWLRNAGVPIDQLTFARQAAELLDAIHTHGRIMHLDLRLDNMTVTDDGVCFVDFGSAAGIKENLDADPRLKQLFSQVMQASHVQQMLGRMVKSGTVTNRALAEVHGRADRHVDVFFLALQIGHPLSNPELVGLVTCEERGYVKQSLDALTAAVLRPKDPSHAAFKSAADLLRGIARIERRGEGRV